MKRRRAAVRAIAGALVAGAAAFHAPTKAHAQVGTQVPDREMAQLGGGRAHLLADVDANVLLFFRPNHEHSRQTLSELAGCQKRLSAAKVRWVAIVSGASSAEPSMAAIRETGFAATTLVDVDDALYGSLGVVLHPVVVIVGRDRGLAAFEPFRSVGMCDVVTARIRRVLGEIADADVQRVLDPPQPANDDGAAARRHLRLAEALLRSGNPDKALAGARRSLELDATLAPSHVLVGEILAAQGNCAQALPAFEAALKIDAGLARARLGVERCKGSR